MLRNTADRGLFDKEGKNFSGDFQVGERTGYSYMLSKPDGTLLSNAFRPYELRRVPETKFGEEKKAYLAEQEAQEANKRAKNIARRVRQEVGKEPAKPRARIERPRVAPQKPEVKSIVRNLGQSHILAALDSSNGQGNNNHHQA